MECLQNISSGVDGCEGKFPAGGGWVDRDPTLELTSKVSSGQLHMHWPW